MAFMKKSEVDLLNSFKVGQCFTYKDVKRVSDVPPQTLRKLAEAGFLKSMGTDNHGVSLWCVVKIPCSREVR